MLEAAGRPGQVLEAAGRPGQVLEAAGRPGQVLEAAGRPGQVLEVQSSVAAEQPSSVHPKRYIIMYVNGTIPNLAQFEPSRLLLIRP